MIIPSIDLMDGKAVQLRQGKDHVLTADKDPIELAKEFNRYGEIGVIDLDAAMGKGDNLALIQEICKVADVRAGGGIRDKKRADALLRAGAKWIIIGTAATPEFLQELPKERVMVAIDHHQGKVVDQGWTNQTDEDFKARAQRLAPYCGSFLCTFVAEEGTMKGMDLESLKQLKTEIPLPITVAGGVASTEEAITISQLGLDVQVGMALYTGKLDLADAYVGSLDFEKCPQIPTIVQDTSGEVLMLAYSTPDSLKQALKDGKGIYFSRSRNEIWHKGETSGHTQALLSCRTDCDRDTLLFQVEQTGPACHTKSYSCFGQGYGGRQFTLPVLYNILQGRKSNLPEGSFTAKLFKDREFLVRKIMEEAHEATLAKNKRELTWEIADAIFFLSVLGVDEGLQWSDIEAELGGRHR
ncbi:MAG: phosphoribosyl-ATP diphosphatase [Vampirovibrio sp.]|nr:phosphoribosyl-ATP diphosphatase [Vampirovibrio sp.]